MLRSSATQNMNIIHVSKQAEDCPDVCYSESFNSKKNWGSFSSEENCLHLLEERTINISHIHSKTTYKIFGNANNDGSAIFWLCLL